MEGNRRPFFSFVVQHVELCSSYLFALTRKVNTFTAQGGQRKQQFPCPSFVIRALIQDVGITHSSLSSCWHSDRSVQFCKG